MASPKPTDLLRDALDAARRALRLLDDDQVPTRLRRVRSYAGGTLPPPLQISLLTELEVNDVFRTKALESWEGEVPGSGRGLASHAFLARPDGWVATVLVEAVALGERHGLASDQTVSLERDSLAAEVAGLRERVRRERDESQRSIEELRAALDAERAPIRADRQGEQRASARLDAERAGWEESVARLQGEIMAQRAEVARLQGSVRSERRARAELAAERDEASAGAFPVDPVGLARLIDDLATHTAALGERPAPPRPSTVDPECPDLDSSIRPDGAEAIDWLVQRWECPVLIDGYNVGFRIGTLEPAPARARVMEVARRLATASRSPLVSVVFDSGIAGGHSGTRAGTLEDVFTAGETADDAIEERCRVGERKVVITNDRELRERCEAHGALALWGDALIEWSRRR